MAVFRTRLLAMGTLVIVAGLSLQGSSAFSATDQHGKTPGALQALQALRRSRTFVPFIRDRSALVSAFATPATDTRLERGTIGLLSRVLVGAMPQGAAFDATTRTLYVANQGDNTMSVVDARSCNARRTAGCGRLEPAFPAGSGPFGIAVNASTHTVYVADSNSDTVTVFNASTCTARHLAGCKHVTATVKVGQGPADVEVDRETNTIYVTNTGPGMDGTGNTVSVINGSTCDAADTTGCSRRPATVPLGQVGFVMAVDDANQTVYVTDPLTNKVSMIYTGSCHAGHTAGCRRRPPATAVGTGPVPVAANPRTHTVYVGYVGDPSVSIINAATCNARRTFGCARIRAPLHVLGGTSSLALDETTDTLFATNNGPGESTGRSNTVSIVNAAACNAHGTAGCHQHAPAALTGADPGSPIFDHRTDTLYVATFDDTLQAINLATCNAKVRVGCGQTTPAAIAGGDPWSMAINSATHTAYVGNDGELEGGPLTITVLNAASCNTVTRAGCTSSPPVIPMQFGSFGLTDDPSTDTIYATNSFDSNSEPGNTVSVIDGATCNATTTSGCAGTSPTVTVGSLPTGAAEDFATHTLYVANSGSNSVSVINTATCNAVHAAGCGQTTPQVPLRNAPFSVAVNQATNTVYVLAPGAPATVSVINGSTCNATDASGCASAPPTVTVGDDAGFAGLAVDQRTNTVYVVNTGDDTVSMINGATCNGGTTAGCAQRPRQVRIGRQSYGFVAVDPTTDLVYVSNTLDDTVSIINGRTCNAHNDSGCHQIAPSVPAGANPTVLAVNPANHTVYVDDIGAGTVSFFRFQAPLRPSHVTASADRGAVRLRWLPGYDGGLPVIYQVIASPACPRCHGLTTPGASGEPFATITGLTRGRTYTFEVRALDAAGTGPASRSSNPVTP